LCLVHKKHFILFSTHSIHGRFNFQLLSKPTLWPLLCLFLGVSGGSESIGFLFNGLICGSFASFWFLQKIKIVV
jgi:hypothetical protein